MPVHQRSSGWSYVAAISWRVVLQRFSFIVFMVLALGLLLLNRVHPGTVQGVRTHLVDGIAPVLDAFARPLTAIEQAAANARSYMSLRTENEKLRTDNASMKQWRDALVTLQRENRELRDLLHFKAEPGLAYISARVIADTGGPFTRGLIITAGATDGAREGMAVMTGEGLIGRVIEVGDWSSRVLLITDLNSRIPVTVAGSGDRAILVGENSAAPKLMYLPRDAVLSTGAQVVTSGHGGIFPPNLPVGTVTETSRGAYNLVPAADMGRINYVRLVDFNLKGGAFNPVAAKVEAAAKKR